MDEEEKLKEWCAVVSKKIDEFEYEIQQNYSKFYKHLDLRDKYYHEIVNTLSEEPKCDLQKSIYEIADKLAECEIEFGIKFDVKVKQDEGI